MQDNRYQNQLWYIKLWRRRWYLWTYWMALRDTIYWVFNGCQPNEWVSSEDSYKDTRWFTFKCIWVFAKGWAEMKMEWWYTMNECCQKARYGN